jgi:hypothetical protein
MWRAMGVLLLMFFSFAAGAWGIGLVAAAKAEGRDVQCIQARGQQICKGLAIDDASLNYNFERKLGGLAWVDCSFTQSGNALGSTIPAIVRGCADRRYVVSFSDGILQTNLWVADGRIVRIDQYDANPMES